MKQIYLKIIDSYQYISGMLPANCRYYPKCSEYAKWQFELNRTDRAVVQSTLRVLRCNQLFSGGIDYPIIKYKRPSLLKLYNGYKIEIKYWFVPKTSKEFFVIKDFNFNNN